MLARAATAESKDRLAFYARHGVAAYPDVRAVTVDMDPPVATQDCTLADRAWLGSPASDRSGLVPRFIALLGLVGGPMVGAPATAVMVGVYGKAPITSGSPHHVGDDAASSGK